MKKSLGIIITFLVLLVAGYGGWMWYCNSLYLRVFDASITVNGDADTDSRLYMSYLGNYFLDASDSERRMEYFIIPQIHEVAVPTEPVPSIITMSFLTPLFFCPGDTEIRAAGTDLFAPGATSEFSENGFSFTINDQMVSIQIKR